MLPRNMAELPAFDDKSGQVNIVIEAPKGSRVKLKHDPERDIFRVRKILPVGLAFPFDYGFVPSTAGGEGDPLDVLVLGDAGLPCCCVVPGKIIGVFVCEQTEKGHTARNDRLVAVPVNADTGKVMQPSIAVTAELKTAIAQFFVKYNELQGKKFRVLGFHGRKKAMEILHNGIKAAAKQVK